jgi:uncharacterized protein YjiS (DUF1127 family)
MRPYYFDFDHSQARHARAVAMARPLAWHRSPPPSPRPGGAFELLHKAAALLRLWRNRLRERQELEGLDYRMQRDIGITPADIARECRKPFWRG